MTSMYVVKRNGHHEEVHFDKITSRIARLAYGLDVDPTRVAQKVIQGFYKGITTAELDMLAVEVCEHLQTVLPDYDKLGARLLASNLHKSTKKKFSEVAKQLVANEDPETGEAAPLLAKDVFQFIQDNATALDAAIVYERDNELDVFGFKTLARSYLWRVNGKVVERPQHAMMRIAVGICQPDLPMVLQAYEIYSKRLATHGSPTWFGAGTPHPTLSSCFLGEIPDDLEGIYEKLKQSAMISKGAGGIGLSCHKVRATGSYIKSTGGSSNGVIPMLRVYNNTAEYVDQGGGKRRGAFAIYLEPWHADIMAFIEARAPGGVEEHHARELFYGLWINDLFMERVEKDETWSLFCPKEAPGLDECHSEEFRALYLKYEATPGKMRPTLAREVVKARTIWDAILKSQQHTGLPYMCYKDSVNKKNNQSNVGVISHSNLCTEVMEYSSETEWSTCTLASIAVSRFASADKEFDHQGLWKVAYFMCKALNKVIDVNKAPCKEAAEGSRRHRYIGIGLQGLADALIEMMLPFESAEAKKLSTEVTETILNGAVEASIDLAARDGPYETYEGSPASRGLLQFDLWDLAHPDKPKTQHSGRWDWAATKARMAKHGLRNALLLAPMPTASTSQILGNNECFEPINSNIGTRRTLAGDFICVQKPLMRKLIALGIWSTEIKNKIVAKNGSIQGIAEIPANIQAVFKTTWEESLHFAHCLLACFFIFIYFCGHHRHLRVCASWRGHSNAGVRRPTLVYPRLGWSLQRAPQSPGVAPLSE